MELQIVIRHNRKIVAQDFIQLSDLIVNLNLSESDIKKLKDGYKVQGTFKQDGVRLTYTTSRRFA